MSCHDFPRPRCYWPRWFFPAVLGRRTAATPMAIPCRPAPRPASEPISCVTSAFSSLASPATTNSLVSAGSDRFARVWDAATGQELRRIRVRDDDDHGGCSPCLSPDGQTLATFDDKDVTLWNVGSGKPIRRFHASEHSFWGSLIFSPDGKLLAYGPRCGLATLFEAASGKKIRSLGKTDMPEKASLKKCVSHLRPTARPLLCLPRRSKSDKPHGLTRLRFTTWHPARRSAKSSRGRTEPLAASLSRRTAKPWDWLPRAAFCYTTLPRATSYASWARTRQSGP